jgi:hypothetical protein
MVVMSAPSSDRNESPTIEERAEEVARALRDMDPTIRASFTEDQYGAVRRAMMRCTRQRGRFPIDLRFSVNLWLQRFFVVLIIGPERRSPERTARERRARRFRVANAVVLAVASVIILLAVLGALYLMKSLLGIDLMPHAHIEDLWS